MKRSRQVALAITGSVVLAGCGPNRPVEADPAPDPAQQRALVVPDLDRELRLIAGLAGQIGLTNVAALTNVTAFTNALASTNRETVVAAGAVADTLAVRATNRANVTLITNQLMLSQTNPVPSGTGASQLARSSSSSYWWWHPWYWRPGYPHSPMSGPGVVNRPGNSFRSTSARSFSPSGGSSSSRSTVGRSTSSRGGFGSSSTSHSSGSSS